MPFHLQYPNAFLRLTLRVMARRVRADYSRHQQGVALRWEDNEDPKKDDDFHYNRETYEQTSSLFWHLIPLDWDDTDFVREVKIGTGTLEEPCTWLDRLRARTLEETISNMLTAVTWDRNAWALAVAVAEWRDERTELDSNGLPDRRGSWKDQWPDGKPHELFDGSTKPLSAQMEGTMLHFL
ncbi:hypothetical protein BDZ90DRAFT_231604 [Jaminaea rosea]|uniref:Uncharacterized protein n=1 Tax=Jaminaea rosea TaxID=1569628 RepID=A0A316UTL2_9BASI|nr:hypothetical protein BDZ90DRAFT_231604 [Jaminaea rosea]PWN28627.1 hypothetical protein BDZ90DRAFT_231604 [Jaminaea rosea]